LEIILGRDTKSLLPTEVILALVERQIDTLRGKAIFIDGFPRDLDQISYSLYFRALMGYRDDPDFFVFIDVPEAVMDERIKFRVICPKCQTPRNTRVLATKEVGYDTMAKKFYLICDNPACGGAKMVPKEGDNLGIEAIRSRIEVDDKVMRTLLGLNGIDKIYLRNSVPVKTAKNYVDDYEITPGYRYELDKKTGQVKTLEEPWVIKDDAGEKSYSLLPAAVAVGLIKQIASVLGL
jgi:adenylate kinase family enzyme